MFDLENKPGFLERLVLGFVKHLFISVASLGLIIALFFGICSHSTVIFSATILFVFFTPIAAFSYWSLLAWRSVARNRTNWTLPLYSTWLLISLTGLLGFAYMAFLFIFNKASAT